MNRKHAIPMLAVTAGLALLTYRPEYFAQSINNGSRGPAKPKRRKFKGHQRDRKR